MPYIDANITTKRISISQMIFLLGIFVKQFYLLPSGSFQIGDFVLIFGCAWYVLEKNREFKINKQENKLLLYFSCIALINLVYFLIFGQFDFIKSTMYYAYNLIVILFFSANISFEQNNISFLEKLSSVLQFSLVTQLAIFLTGTGAWYGSVRYMGTFNDPNQYGVFILFCVLGIYVINTKLRKRTWVWTILGVVLISFSASTGNMVGFVVFVATMFCMRLRKLTTGKAIVSIIAVGLIAIALIGLMTGIIPMPEFFASNQMVKRIIDKLSLLSNDSSSGSLFDDRGWDIIGIAPEFLFFGAGEGYYERFGTNLEVHSSVLGPLFYYGVVPFLLFASWLISKIKNLDKNLWCVYLALLTESFFLVNTRQPMFWMLILLAGVPSFKEMSLYTSKSVDKT